MKPRPVRTQGVSEARELGDNDSGVCEPRMGSTRFAICSVLLVTVLVGSLLAFLVQPPLHQDLAYHGFADRRTFFGVANFLDVFTNVTFLLVGLAGLRHCLRHPQPDSPRAWQIFFAGVALVCFGSAWYHLEPNNATLVWDRLPMALAFMGLFVGLLAEHTTPRAERVLLWPALLVGLASVVWWAYADDLRLYYWVQLAPRIVVPLVVALFPGTYTHRAWLLVGFACYGVAKIAEIMDASIFAATRGMVSGHSLKHLWAALGVLALYHMIRQRGRNPDPGLSSAQADPNTAG